MKLMFTSGRARLGSCLLLSSLVLACGEDEQPPGSKVSEVPHELAHEASEAYQEVALAAYQESLEKAIELQESLLDFVNEPTKPGLDGARAAWLAAREPYLQTEVFRFYEGPIDAEETGPEGLLNAWPLDEAYIDYVEGDEGAGIINDPEVEISPESLSELNEQGGEKNIATGYHAIEFLLWGQDLDPEGPGNRPYTDYLTDGEGTHENQDRRGEYLLATAELLVENLQYLVDAWSPDDSENYRAEFEELEPAEALRRVLTGMILLSGFETGGERIQTALDTQDQEDEHSCFSDNTHRDMIQDIQGVLNVYLGSYQRADGESVEGTGVREIVATHDPVLADQLEQRIRRSLGLAQSLPRPFDQQIVSDNPEGREKLQILADSLKTQKDLLEQVFLGFGLDVPEDPQ